MALYRWFSHQNLHLQWIFQFAMLVITRGYVQSERRDMALSWSPKTNLETAWVSEPEIGHPNIKGVHCNRGPDRCPSGVFRKRQTTPATARDILQRQRSCFFLPWCCRYSPKYIRIIGQVFQDLLDGSHTRWGRRGLPSGFSFSHTSAMAYDESSPFPDENPWFQASFPDGWKILGVLTSHPQTHRTATRYTWRRRVFLGRFISMRHGVDDTHQDSGRCRHGVHFHHCSLVVPWDDLDVWITGGGTPDTAILVGTITCPCVIIVARHLTKSFSIIRNCGQIAHFFLVSLS